MPGRSIPIRVESRDIDEVRQALEFEQRRRKAAEHQRDLLVAAIDEHRGGRPIATASMRSRDGLLYARRDDVVGEAPSVTRKQRELNQLLEDALDAGLVEFTHHLSGQPFPTLTAEGERWLSEHKEAMDA